MSICGCWWRVDLLACHHGHTALSLSLVRFFSAVCGRLLRFLRDFIIVSVVVSSRIRYQMIR